MAAVEPAHVSSDATPALDNNHHHTISIDEQRRLGSKDNSNDDKEKHDDAPQTPSEPATTSVVDPAYPEGTLKAWLVVAGSFICNMFTWGFVTAFGVLAEYYRSTLLPGYSPAQIAWISSMQYCLLMLPGLFVGRLFDAGLLKPILGFGMLLLVISQIMVSFSATYWQLLLSQGLSSGIAFGIIFSMAISVPAHWFKARRGLAFGIVSSGSSVGGFMFPMLCKRLLPTLGFGWTMRLLGFLMLVCLGLAWLVMHTRLPPPLHLENGGWRRLRFLDPSAFRDPAYALLTLGSTLVLFGMFTPFTYLDTFAHVHRLPLCDYYLSILNGASILGRTIPGLIADRYGGLNALLPNVYASAILAAVFPLCTNPPGMIVWTVLYGFSSGAFSALLAPCTAQLGSTDSVGTRLGMIYACMSLGALLGLPISGAILGKDGGQFAEKGIAGTADGSSRVDEHLNRSGGYNWWGAYSYAGACILAGAVCVHLSRQFAVHGSICSRERRR